jgi:putative flavoprotein involved in K+ transport
VLSLPDAKLRARTVVVASGAFQRAFRPAGSETLPGGVTQLLAEEYRHAGALPPGAVLVVGSAQTGCQIAEELHHAGREVFLACGRCPWAPRRLDGKDLVWWLMESGFLDRTPDQLPSPLARLVGNVQVTGHDGGRDMHFRTLHALGVELLGRFAGAEGSTIHFADDLAASVDFGDARLAEMMQFIDAYCAVSGVPAPQFDAPHPLRLKTRTELDVVEDRIGAIIWTSGYRPDYGWMKLPVFDELGFPIQIDGHSAVPGLYFCGVHWMRKNRSAFLFGVGEDAGVVARHIVANRS